MKNVANMTLPELLKFDVTHEVEKAKPLSERDDTFYGMQMDVYRAIIEAYGFELVLETPFQGRNVEERHFVYAHRDGLLLSMDSYDGERVNGGNVYYTWRKNADVKDTHHLTSSGRYLDRGVYTLWEGSHDCREAIVHNLNSLRAEGLFVTPWPQRPFLWLLHYMNTQADGYDCDAINSERIALLPEWVREMIGE
jgi:hypothetical protein